MAQIAQVKNNIKKVLSHSGFEDIECSIYAALVLANRPLTAREIAHETSYAYSTTINALNALIKQGHVHKTRRSRKNVYCLATDLAHIVKARINRFSDLLQTTAASIHRLDERYKERLREVLETVNNALCALEKMRCTEEGP
ncbi:MAG: helix-turn-helix domain-containing protein [Candidatus Thermoplasmatota archaeon]|nr:helix-turn-helix domain-containing protein [Candidatus Thermoplasmatota archaeon]